MQGDTLLRLALIGGLALLLVALAARYLPRGHRVWVDDLPGPEDLARFGGEPVFGGAAGTVDENAELPAAGVSAEDDENAEIPEDDRRAE